MTPALIDSIFHGAVLVAITMFSCICVYSLCKEKWIVKFILAITLTATLLFFWFMFIRSVENFSRPSPKLTPSGFAGHWVGSFDHRADLKPTLPVEIVPDFLLRENGTCYVHGFLQPGSPVRIYSGEGQWRFEKNRYVVISLTLDGVQHEDRLWIVWTRIDGKWQWWLRWPWFDPDCHDPNMRNDLRFTKVAPTPR